jgi:hypothetical protein
MIKRLLLSLAAGAAIFGTAALIPAAAGASSLAGAANAINLNAQNVSDVVQVQHRHRHRHHRHAHRHHHRNWGWGGIGFYAPYAFAPRRCGYVWSPRHYRHVYRCW